MKLVLVIERDAECVRLIKAILERDFGIAHVASAGEAMNLLNAVRPDVVVYDIETPITDAFAFVRALKESPDTSISKIPIIATTARDDVDSHRARAAGFDVLLHKPVDPDYLPQIVTLVIAASINSAGPR